MRLSATALNTYANHCPKALWFYLKRDRAQVWEAGTPLEFGRAAHELLHAAALAMKRGEPRQPALDSTALALTRKYRLEIVRTAKVHVEDFIFDWSFPGANEYEFGVAFDDAWKSVPWDSEQAAFRAIFDSVGTHEVEDEEWGNLTVANALDYKTGHGAGEHLLDSVQSLVLLKCLRVMYPQADAYEVVFVATQWRGIYRRRWIAADDEDKANMLERDRDLALCIQGARQTDFAARPGVGCVNCPFAHKCEAFASAVEGALTRKALSDPQKVAAEYGVLTELGRRYEEHLRELTKLEPLRVGDKLIGFRPTTRRMVKDPAAVAALFFYVSAPQTLDDARRLFRSFAALIELGVTATEKVLGTSAKALGFKTKKACIEEKGKDLFELRVEPKFGWWTDVTSKGKELDHGKEGKEGQGGDGPQGSTASVGPDAALRQGPPPGGDPPRDQAAPEAGQGLRG
jgi:hypothetical protein